MLVALPAAFILPFALLYFLLHAGPMLRVQWEVSIRGGTRWWFFASEVALFSSYAAFAPSVMESNIGRWAVVIHVGMHVVFAILDALAHDFLLSTALIPFRNSRLLWFAKEVGLALDTGLHAIVVVLLASSAGVDGTLVAAIPAVGGYVLVTHLYRSVQRDSAA